MAINFPTSFNPFRTIVAYQRAEAFEVCPNAPDVPDEDIERICASRNLPFCNCDAFGISDFVADAEKGIGMAQALYQEGEVKFADALIADSIDGLATRLEMDPDNEEIASELARLYLFKGTLAEAKNISTEVKLDVCNLVVVLETRSGSKKLIAAHFELFKIYWYEGDYKKAREQYDVLQAKLDKIMEKAASPGDRVLALEYRFNLAYEIGDLVQAAAVLKEAQQLLPPQDHMLRDLNAKLENLLDQLSRKAHIPLDGRRDYLEDRVDQLIAEPANFSNYLDAFYLSGQHLGEWDTAYGYLQRAERLAPTHRKTIIAQAYWMDRRGNAMDAQRLISNNLDEGMHSQNAYFYKQMVQDAENQIPEISSAMRDVMVANFRSAVSQEFKRECMLAYETIGDRLEYFPESVVLWGDRAVWAERIAFMMFANDPAERANKLFEAHVALRRAVVLLSAFDEPNALDHPAAPALRANFESELLRLSLFGNSEKYLDDMPLELVDFNGVVDPGTPREIEPGKQLQLLLDRNENYHYYVNDPYRMVDATLGFVGHVRAAYPELELPEVSKDNLAELGLVEAITLVAQITEAAVNYRVTDVTSKVDVNADPIEDRFAAGDFYSGVCRNYSALFAAIFESIKYYNPNLTNAYAFCANNEVHAWNIVFVLEENRTVGYVLDVTRDDKDGVFGNDLGGLSNHAMVGPLPLPEPDHQ